MRQFFTSDHHMGHANILRHCAPTRPYRSLDHMHSEYIARWNAVVRPEDTVWYLGDFSLKFTFVQAFLHLLNGNKHLIIGNHDVCFKGHPQQIQQYEWAGFQSVQRQHVVELEGKRFALCHFPYRVPEYRRSPDPRTATRQERFAPVSIAPGDFDEVALVHGHVHSFWRARVGANPLPELNVAADAWDGTPVSEAQLLALYATAVAHEGEGQLDIENIWQPLHVDTVYADI